MATAKLKKKMAVGRHASAKKRARQAVKRSDRNKHALSTMKGVIKRVRVAIEEKDKKTAEAALKKALPIIAKTMTKGGLHANTGARYISRLTKAVNRIS